MAIKVTRLDLDASGLRRAASRSDDAAAARRVLALALVLEGKSRRVPAAAGMDRQSLRDWVHRYNAEGLCGLSDRPRPGPRPRLDAQQMVEVIGWTAPAGSSCQNDVVSLIVDRDIPSQRTVWNLEFGSCEESLPPSPRRWGRQGAVAQAVAPRGYSVAFRGMSPGLASTAGRADVAHGVRPLVHQRTRVPVVFSRAISEPISISRTVSGAGS
jgi:Homeodomain-like domain